MAEYIYVPSGCRVSVADGSILPPQLYKPVSEESASRSRATDTAAKTDAKKAIKPKTKAAAKSKE